MAIENYNMMNEVPLYIDPVDIVKVYLKCLNFIENDLFEIVHEKNKKQGVSIKELIEKGMSPRLSSQSQHGICLRSDINFYSKNSSLKVINFFDLNNLPDKIKIIKSIDDVNCFCLVPKVDLYLFEYQLLARSFFQSLPLKS